MPDQTHASRRAFLKFATAAAAAATGIVPENVRKALAIAPHHATGTIMDVEHVVILMQENRSFDHYFGTLRGVRGYGDPRAVQLADGQSVFSQPATNSQRILPFRFNTATTNAACLPSLDHSWKGTQAEWNGWDVWIKHKTAMTMGYFTRTDIPYYHALADAFTICDAYHASIFGPTNPNRLYLFSGTSGLSVGDHGHQVTTNVDDGNPTADMALDRADFRPFAWQTYGDALMAHGVEWKIYQERDNFSDNPLASFAQFRNLDPTSTRYKAARAIVPGSTAETIENSEGRFLIEAFEKDVAAGSLPPISWIVPPAALSEHPDAPPGYGEFLISRLLDVFVRHPDVWSKTVFILNYDENDGFFDHMPPPVPALNASQGTQNISTEGEVFDGTPVGLGPRVPMILISPWSRGGWVNSELFDHTSVLRFLEKRFGVTAPHITPWRRAVCGDLTSAFDFAQKDAHFPDTLPDTATYLADTRNSCKLGHPAVPQTQAMPTQENGQRPTRPLPYRVRVTASQTGPQTVLTFTNDSVVAATFQVFDGSVAGPRHVTVAARSLVHMACDQGGPVRVHGPNGFLRAFTPGSVPHSPRISEIHDANNGILELQIHNPSEDPVTVHIAMFGYAGYTPQSLTVNPGASRSTLWTLDRSDHWYNLRVTSDTQPGFVTQLAGHLETGKPSKSDPLLGLQTA